MSFYQRVTANVVCDIDKQSIKGFSGFFTQNMGLKDSSNLAVSACYYSS